MSWLFWNLGASTSWNPLSLSKSVMGLLKKSLSTVVRQYLSSSKETSLNKNTTYLTKRSSQCVNVQKFCFVFLRYWVQISVQTLAVYTEDLLEFSRSCEPILILCSCMTTLTEVFPCFFLSCKANARVKPAKTGHGPHSSKFLCCSMYFLCCSMYCLFCVVLCIVCVYMCTVLLPPGGYPVAVKYVMSYHIISYHIISYHIISYHIIPYHIILYVHVKYYRWYITLPLSKHVIISDLQYCIQ